MQYHQLFRQVKYLRAKMDSDTLILSPLSDKFPSLNKPLHCLSAVDKLALNLDSPTWCTLQVPENTFVCLLNKSGTAILHPPEPANPIPVYPNQAYFASPGTENLVLLSRGEHNWHTVSWQISQAELLCQKLMALLRNISPSFPATVPLSLSLIENEEIINRAAETASNTIDLSVLGIIHQLVSRFEDLPKLELPECPESVLKVLRDLHEFPLKHWGMREAARQSNYSEFYFSKLFKSAMGVGFHEYLDTLRAKLAVDLFLQTRLKVNDIANKCAFQRPEQLRSVLKTRLGLTPREIRSTPTC